LADKARAEVADLSNDDINQRIRMIEGNMRAMKVESQRLNHETARINGGIKESNMKIKQNKQLPWLVSNIVEVLDLEP